MRNAESPDLPFIRPEQLSLLPDTPLAGQRWRSKITGNIACVLQVFAARYTWVTIRIHGDEQTIRLDNFLKAFKRL